MGRMSLTTQYNKLYPMFVPNIQKPDEVVPEIYLTKFNWREKRWTNKGNDKQKEDDSFLHKTTSHTQAML